MEVILFCVLIFISICDGPKFKIMFIMIHETFVVSFILRNLLYVNCRKCKVFF